MENLGTSDLSAIIDEGKRDNISKRFFLVLCLVLSFLIFNPFIAIFVISLFSAYFKIPRIWFFISGSLAFTLFFFFREYNVVWSSSSDDIPAYIELYFSNKSLTLYDLFTRFFAIPGNHEPLWHLPFWLLLNVFDGNEKVFIFVHYLFIFVLLFYTLNSISERYYSIAILAYFFLTPVALDSVFHIWRQQLASTIFLLGCNIYLTKEKKKGLFLIYSSVLIHLVCSYFLAIFLVFNFLRKRNVLEHKIKFFFYCLLLCLVFILLYNAALNFLASLNLDRVLTYAEGTEANAIRLFIVMSFFMGAMFLSHVFYKNDDLNKLIIFITFAVTTMTLAFPAADSIFSRLTYFTVPLIGLYFLRWFVLNFPKKWVLGFVIFTFVSGAYRIIPLITEKRISAQFLALGHPLDPFMGIIKMLFFL
jgi:hypothetical protein